MIPQILGGIAGASYGLTQNNQRITNAFRNELMARKTYDILADRKRASRDILEGNLSVGAMQANANNREQAIAAFQQESAQAEKAGLSGASAGTPFYKLDADIALNRVRLEEGMQATRIGYDSAVRQARSSGQEVDLQLQQAMWGLQEAGKELSYVESPVAQALSMGTGALSGIAMANQVDTAVVSLTGYSIEDNIKKATKEVPAWLKDTYGQAKQAIHDAELRKSMAPKAAPGAAIETDTVNAGMAAARAYSVEQAFLAPSAMGGGGLDYQRPQVPRLGLPGLTIDGGISQRALAAGAKPQSITLQSPQALAMGLPSLTDALWSTDAVRFTPDWLDPFARPTLDAAGRF